MPAILEMPVAKGNALDAFDAEAVFNAELAAAPVADVSGYKAAIDREATIAGKPVPVVVCYPNSVGEIDVFRYRGTDAVLPDVAALLSGKEYQAFFADAERLYFEREDMIECGIVGY